MGSKLYTGGVLPLKEKEKPSEKGKKAGQFLQSVYKLSAAKDNLENTKLKRSGILDSTEFTFQGKNMLNPDIPQMKNIFEPSIPSGDNFVSDFMNKTLSPWSTRIKPTSEAINTMGIENISNMLIDKGYSPKDVSNIMNVESYSMFSGAEQVMSEATTAVSEATAAIPEAIEGSLEAIEGAAPAVASKIGEVGGKALEVGGKFATGINVATGAKRTLEGMKKGDFEETVQGGIQAASPWLLASGPAGWAVLGASFLEDMFFD